MPDPLWINASGGAPAYSANELRQAMATALLYGGRNLGARQGVRPGGNQLNVSLAVSTITVRSGVSVVDPGLSTPQGPYWVAIPADETHTLTAAHATNPRKDIVILRVYDHDEDTSGLRLARSEYIAGVASGTPSEPAVPAGSFRLATIDVPASGGGSAVVTNNFPFAVASGGILPVRSQTERDALSGYPGLAVWRRDTTPNWLDVHNGTDWAQFLPTSHMPTGVLAWGNRATAKTGITAEDGVLRIDNVSVAAGRLIRISVQARPFSTVNTDSYKARLRVSTSGAATTSSTEIKGHEQKSHYSCDMWAPYRPGSNQVISVLFSLALAAGSGTFSSEGESSGTELLIEDIGPAGADGGTDV